MKPVGGGHMNLVWIIAFLSLSGVHAASVPSPDKMCFDQCLNEHNSAEDCLRQCPVLGSGARGPVKGGVGRETTYVDCISPVDKQTVVRVIGLEDAGGEREVITVGSDSRVLMEDGVQSHVYSGQKEIYQGRVLKLTLKSREPGPIPATLEGSASVGPLSCRELR
jgi:hypothetical protein